MLIGQKLRPVSRSRQTDRQTDKQTNKQMKGQSEIAYLPKFAKMMSNLMIIMTSILKIKNILKFKIIIIKLSCYENMLYLSCALESLH